MTAAIVVDDLVIFSGCEADVVRHFLNNTDLEFYETQVGNFVVRTIDPWTILDALGIDDVNPPARPRNKKEEDAI